MSASLSTGVQNLRMGGLYALAVGLACLWLGAAPTAAQAPLGEPAAPNFDHEWRWVDFGPDDGIPPGAPRDLQEIEGTPWLWTEGGLVFYDDFRWRPAPLPESIAPSSITYFSEDLDGSVVVVAAGRVFLGDESGFDEVALPGPTPSETVHRALRDRERGWILSLTSDDSGEEPGYLAVLSEGAIVRTASLGGAPPVWRTRTGAIWTNLPSGLQVREAGGWLSLESGLSSQQLVSRVADADDGSTLAFRTLGVPERGVYAWKDRGTPVHVVSEGRHPIVSGDISADGTYALVVHDTGDLRQRVSGRWSQAPIRQARRGGVALVRFGDDARDHLWLAGADRLQLYRGALGRWAPIRNDFPNPRNRVHALALHPETGLWQATSGGLNAHYEPGDSRWFTEILGHDLRPTTALSVADDGAVWIGSGGAFSGALRFADGAWRHYGAPEGLSGGRVHQIARGRQGSMWFAAIGTSDDRGAGVFRWTEQTGFESWSSDRGIPDRVTYDVLDLGEEVWIASISGLTRVRGSQTTEFPITAGAFALTQAPDGRIWYAIHPSSRGGIGYLGSDDELVQVGIAGGPAAERVWSLSVGDDDTMWAGTSAGVARWREGGWTLLGPESGLDAIGVWPLLIDGTVVLAGTQGGGMWILDRAEESDPAPLVTIVTPIVERNDAIVRWKANAYWGSVSSRQVATRSRFDDGAWSDWTTARETRARGLASGEHRFEIEAKGLFGQIASAPYSASFTIPPPLFLRPIVAAPMASLGLALLLLWAYTARRRAEQATALLQSEQRLRTLVESAPEAIGLLNAATGRFVVANDNAAKLFGISQRDLTSIDPFSFSFEEDSESTAREIIDEALAGEHLQRDWTVRAASGEKIPSELHLVRLPHADGDLLRMSLIDKRDRARAEEVRVELEAQLRQAQKLEAVGKLTGGIAHDFNNLLTVIRGNLDLVVSDGTELSAEDAELIEHAIQAADRSADLTRRLLSFSRKQPLAPQRLSVGALLQGMIDLIRRSLGETIQVSVKIEDGLRPVLVDPSELENAILNLAINSRDAMPEGGDLSIEASNVRLDEFAVSILEDVEPGEFVCLSVTDGGTGMPSEVVDRAFDPFFTTKDVGEGSGLGLSMAYGFVRQSGGAARLYSEIGHGTTVKLFLPASEGPLENIARSETPAEAPRGRGERILIVEDEGALRALVVTLLEKLGYEPHPAEDAAAGIRHLESEADVDLLLSDIVLPGGMDGIELARIARTIRPGIRVLHFSGYAEGKVMSLAADDPDFVLLPKPFERRVLAQRIRELLDA